MTAWYRVVTSYFVCAIKTEDEVVVEAAPIMRWSVGKPINAVRSWINSKGGQLELLPNKFRRVDD